MLIKLNKFIKEVKDGYDTFRFGDVYKTVLNYVSSTLSAFYLDFTKDILYIEDPKSNRRLSVQTVFYKIVDSLIKLLSPILPHTMSEAYDCLPFKSAEDVYLTDMPEVVDIQDDLEEKYDEFMKYRDIVLKALEDARSAKVIGKSFNAKLTVTLDADAKKVFEVVKDNAATLLIVSQIEFVDGDEFKVEVTPAEGRTCARCRMIVPFVSVDELCPRCDLIVNKK